MQDNRPCLAPTDAHFQIAIASLPFALLLFDHQATVLYANPPAQHLFNHAPNTPLPRSCGEFIRCTNHLHNQQACGHTASCDQCLLLRGLRSVLAGTSTTETLTGEYMLTGETGPPQWIRFSCTPLIINEQRGALLALEDISQRKQVEEERKRLQAQLVQTQKMEAIGALAGGIAHDFNNILSAILGYTEMARDALPPGSQAARNLGKVMKASLRASSLAKQILAFSRQTETEKVPLEPALVVKEAVNLLRSTLPATIVIRQRVVPRPKLIFADPTQVHQVLLNLCTNSFHAMEQTGGILDISLEDCRTTPPRDDPDTLAAAPATDFVRLSVGDTGPGIPLDLQEKIFQPYFTTKEIGKGTGMGLAIVHSIVTKHGGFITCKSSPGNGTVFHLFFPAFTGTCPSQSQPAPPIATTGREHILFVDDEQNLVETGTAMLQRLGYQVTGRSSSLEGLDIFQKQPHRFDAVITDQTMPEMTGIDLARRMLEIRPDLPIILCTGYSGLVSEEQVLALGIKAFTMKPLTNKELAATLRRVLDEK